MLTTKEAGKKLFVCEETIRQYIRKGVGPNNEKLPAMKIPRGRKWEYRIKQNDLENFRKKHLTIKDEK
jgi:hypothetical protein